MSSKIEVSRELVQRIADHCKFWVDHPYLEAISDVEVELRALLAAPVVERQPAAYLDENGKFVFIGYENLRTACWIDGNDRAVPHTWSPLYTAPPELAELQAKCELSDIRISQLTVAIEQSSRAQLENYHMATRAWTESKELQATIARLTSENERIKKIADNYYALGVDANLEIERLKGGQGEPIAIGAWRKTLNRFHFISRDIDYMRKNYGDFADFALIELSGDVAELEATYVPIPQPAPVSVVQFANELIDGAFEGGNFGGDDIQDIAVKHGLLRVETREEPCGESCACREHGFPAECYRKTACLDKVKELNQ